METPEWTVSTEHQIVAKLAAANRLPCPAGAETVAKTVQRFVERFLLEVNRNYPCEYQCPLWVLYVQTTACGLLKSTRGGGLFEHGAYAKGVDWGGTSVCESLVSTGPRRVPRVTRRRIGSGNSTSGGSSHRGCAFRDVVRLEGSPPK